MRIRNTLLISAASTVLCAFASAQSTPSTPSQAPTLADIARERSTKSSRKVITSEDMKAAPVEEAPAPPAEEANKPPTTKEAHDSAMSVATEKVVDLKDREGVLQRSLVRYRASLEQAQKDNNASRITTFQESIDATEARLVEMTKDRENAEKDLEKLKANPPPPPPAKKPAKPAVAKKPS